MPYEQILPFLASYATALRANVLVFNYRGVGDSTGWPRRSSDLVLDGRAAIEYVVRTHSVPPVCALARHVLHHGQL